MAAPLTRRALLARAGALALRGLGACAAGTSGVACSRHISRKAPTASLPAVRFADVTEAAGLTFQQSDASCGRHYFVEFLTPGAALFDANGDGFLDIYFPQPEPIGACRTNAAPGLQHRLYLNDGKGRFTLAEHAFGSKNTGYAFAAAVGDYNNDGHPDLYVACYGGNTLFKNRGDGTFEDVTRQAGVAAGGFCTGAVWFDYNNDGLLDLYVIRYVEWTPQTNIICQAPNGKPDDCHPTQYPAAHNVLYRNNGDGTFTDVTQEAGLADFASHSLGVVAADFDGDGRLDLFVANDQEANFLFHNLGNGRFEEVALQENVAFGIDGRKQANMGVAVGDYDEDGDLDIVVTTFGNEPTTLYRNDGGYFTDASALSNIGPATYPQLKFGIGFLDTRNLGRLDLFQANGHISHWAYLKDATQTWKQANQLLLNDGSGRFTDTPSALPPADIRSHRAACFGDIDNDGRIDILVTAQNDRPTLLHNETPAGNWLILRLIDRHGCCTPVGTRCTATVQGKKLLRVVLGGGSYGGESDHRVHFGLGSAVGVERLEIRWISGTTQVLTAIAGNQILPVAEPS